MLIPAASANAGGNADITVTPSSIDFPAQYVGHTSPAETVTVTNEPQNAVNLTVQAPSISGAAQFDFAITSDNCAPYPRTLQNTESCTLGVEFTPTTTSFRGATLNVPSNDFDEPNSTVTLTGDGVEAPIADLLVGKAGGMLIGDNVYEPAPLTQIISGKIKRGRAKDYVVSVGNDANNIGITVQGCASSHGFKITYSHQGVDVTDDVVAGTYLSEIATSNPDPLDVRVKAKRSAHGTLVCNVTGSAEGSDDDAVQLKLQRKR